MRAGAEPGAPGPARPAGTGRELALAEPSGWEPLAAVYPREILPLVRLHIEQRELALHRLIDAGIAAGLLIESRMAAQDPGVFRNVNTPEDLAERTDSTS